MSKKKKKVTPKKGMSESNAIIISVLLFTGGLVGAIFALKYVVGYFFPDLW